LSQQTTKFLLDEDRIPKAWYNVVADLENPPPPALHPGTLQSATADDSAPLFPMVLIEQSIHLVVDCYTM
jgi:tryptophan synthase beta chain